MNLKIKTILMLLNLVLFSSCIRQNKENSETNNSSYQSNNETYNVNEEKSPCNFDESEMYDFLTSNSFTLNGNGRVEFYNNEIGIYGGRADLRGSFKIVNSTIKISNLQAVSGYFDASNNNGSNGSLYVNCDGNISGSLYSGGESISVNILKN